MSVGNLGEFTSEALEAMAHGGGGLSDEAFAELRRRDSDRRAAQLDLFTESKPKPTGDALRDDIFRSIFA